MLSPTFAQKRGGGECVGVLWRADVRPSELIRIRVRPQQVLGGVRLPGRGRASRERDRTTRTRVRNQGGDDVPRTRR